MKLPGPTLGHKVPLRTDVDPRPLAGGNLDHR